MIKTIAAATTAVFVATSAWAMPTPAPVAAQAGVVEIQYKKDKDSWKKGPQKQSKKRRYDRNRYRAGQRYKSAPKGWRRHGKRPSNWRTRGCIIVGPVWFCP